VDTEQLRAWILILSASAALLAGAVGAWLVAWAYRRKLRGEERLTQVAQAEADIRLVQTFTDLVLVAVGVGRYAPSPEMVRALLATETIGTDDFNKADNGASVHAKFTRFALLPASGAGPTASRFAVYGIAALASRHELLRELGIKALELERVREAAPEQVPELLKRLRGQA
jgi:hypothetical protein